MAGERFPVHVINEAMSGDRVGPPQRLPTLQDVARVAGVSRATVSRVINNVRNVDPDIHRAVSEAVAATGYVPNRAARSLVTGRAGSIALVVSELESREEDDPFMGRYLTDPFFGRVVGGLLSVLREAGVNLGLNLVASDHARRSLIADLRQARCDGVALISLHPHDPLPALLSDAGLPVVLFGRPPQGLSMAHVDLANAAGAAMAATRLLGRGCRRLVTVAGPLDQPAGVDRLDGFLTALAAAGVTDVPRVVSDFSQAGGGRAMEQLLREHPDLDGVFVASDLMAQGALPVLRDYGRRIPDDVAVVGFDDSSAAVASRPPLTTIRQPVEDMAAEMARLLLARVEAGASAASGPVMFEPTLVVRDSA
jgi:DNA-binding LacI/PurR family transcriptional regulator